MHTLGNLFVSLLLTSPAAADSADSSSSPVGRVIENFQLQDHLGAGHELAEWSDRKAVVLAFLGTECPLAARYGRRLAELAAEYGPRGVAFVGVNSNQQDSLAEIGQYVRRHQIEFPLLKDPANKVADLFGAERTPEVFVLDSGRVVRYHGRVDDQYGVGYRRSKPEHRELAAALDALLADEEVAVSETKAAGCRIGRMIRIPPTGDITYSKHVAAILQQRCVRCHRPGQVAPFAMTSYAEVVGWTETIREVIEAGRMPPWHANPAFGHFSNDNRLSDAERKLIVEWIDHGAPEGDPADLPPLVEYVEGWRIPEPNVVLAMPVAFTVPATGTVEYQEFELGYTIENDTWIQAAEVRPGNPAVVHHLVLFFLPPGRDLRTSPEAVLFNSLAGFAPGMPSSTFPQGTAKRVPAGSKLLIQAHYTPNGREQTDVSTAGLVFADPETVKKQLMTQIALSFKFRIPPGDANHRVEAQYRFDQDMRLYALLPHMHLRGKAFRFDATFPDGRTETLLDVPRYDFNWQNSYVLAEPKRMPEGTVIHCTGVFDNSSDNPMNPDPAAAVTWGDQTWQEMMIGTFEVVRKDQDFTLGLPQVRKLADDEYEVTFRYRPDAECEVVYLAGAFNEWKPTDHKMDGPDAEGRYTTTLKLGKGPHEYKFILDGKKWRADPGNPDQVGQNHNSVLRIP
ncbi:MAG TPA: redoxin domain-containing protein [Pirellulales bacterium]|nr:redoxin domain-containing protein [Pirellulales bacterium]